MMGIDPTITLGALINVAAMVIGGTIFAVSVRNDVRALAFRVGRLEGVTDRIDSTLQRVAVQDERMLSYARRLETLEKYIFIGTRDGREDVK